MAEVTGAYLGAKALEAEGVDTFFYILSAPIVADCLKLGLKGISVRNETAAGMMAHGYSRATGKPGVVLSSHGPGTANVAPALANAMYDACPVINFGASANLRDRGVDVFQEMDQVAIMRPVTKWAEQATHTHKIPQLVSTAFRHALSPPFGAVYLDFPNDIVNGVVEDSDWDHPARLSSHYRTDARPYGDPALIKKAVDLLAKAEKPVIVTGSGVFWSQGGPEMEEFVDTTGIPFYTTPQGRGVVSEDHKRFYGGARSMAFQQADVVLVVGTRANVILSNLLPPRWNPDAKFIVVNTDSNEIGHNAPAEIGIVGDAKGVFGQLTEEARGRFDPNAETPWIQELAQRDAARMEQESSRMDSDDMPIHPLRLCREVRDFIDRDAIVCVDGNEILSFARHTIPTYLPGHRLNAGTHGTMGVGVPFGIAAQAARPDKQVVVLTGDGSFGWNGMEVDTAVRFDLPVMFVICNNGSMTAADETQFNPQKHLGFTSRYDKMMEAMGGHGEFVERPDEIRPALERAYASGKPALVNVIVNQYAKASSRVGLAESHE